MRLDHLSYAIGHESFIATAQYLGSQLGAAFVDAGVHPRFGTRNLVIPLAHGSYVEVVTPLDHPSADNAPFGQAVARRARAGGGWLSWVVGVDDIEPVAKRLGQTTMDGHRVRPDGAHLRWLLLGLLDGIVNPQLPLFVQWLSDAREAPFPNGSAGIEVERLELAGDARSVEAWLGRTDGLGDVEVTWVDGEDPGLVAVHFSTLHGSVRID